MTTQPLLISGPCLLEGPEMAFEIARNIKRLSDELGVEILFKGSFDKANRSHADSPRGPGLEVGLALLKEVRDEFGLKVCTDVHEVSQVEAVASVCSMIQIPAFLSRQTDLILCSAKTGCDINIKKGQFMDAKAALMAYEKADGAGSGTTWITERGTTFGYGDLVVDFRTMAELLSAGVPVCYDATHSVQKPSAAGTQSGGDRQFVEPLLKAAIAVGAKGFFFETHPAPETALSDSALQLTPQQWEQMLRLTVSQ